MSRSTWLHLRIPFSFFLLPVYLFAINVAPEISIFEAVVAFICLHFFLYPASNGFNSYFDKDKGSIGGLEFPPPVSKHLYFTALVFDAFAIMLGLLIGPYFAFALLCYGLVSKAYSHPSIRLKQYPFISWLVAGIFQGAFTLWAVVLACSGDAPAALLSAKVLWAGVLSTLLLWASYPITQVYQHEEDRERGDITLSIFLGVKRTFLFTGVVFLIGNLAFVYFLLQISSWEKALLFQILLLPVLVYFVRWAGNIIRKQAVPVYRSVMRMNLLSSSALIIFFILWFILGNN